jgi:hypothetical protein
MEKEEEIIGFLLHPREINRGRFNGPQPQHHIWPGREMKCRLPLTRLAAPLLLLAGALTVVWKCYAQHLHLRPTPRTTGASYPGMTKEMFVIGNRVRQLTHHVCRKSGSDKS